MTDEVVIEVQGLEKRFGDFVVVRDLDLTVRKGQIFGFLGPNGSGKTTTMRMLVGLLQPDGGRGQCLGYDIVRDRAAIRRRVGYMTQHFSLYSDLTVLENLEFVARVYGVDEPHATARRSVRELGLSGREHQRVAELSGGWKQRLALGAATLAEPELLLLDEPTAGVDPKARREFWNRIYELAQDGLTVLVSTHYMDEAERCHEIAYLAYGQLLATGTAGEVIDRSGLSMWEASGAPHDLGRLAEQLREQPAVAMATPFGNRLHVGGTEADSLERSLAPYRKDERFRWRRVEPSLEDVFIHLLSEAHDERAQQTSTRP